MKTLIVMSVLFYMIPTILYGIIQYKNTKERLINTLGVINLGVLIGKVLSVVIPVINLVALVYWIFLYVENTNVKFDIKDKNE